MDNSAAESKTGLTFCESGLLRLIPPLIADYGDWSAISQWIKTEKPDAIVASVLAEYEALNDYLKRNTNAKKRPPLLCVVDAKVDGRETGVVQNLEVEAGAAIDLVTSRVERAIFGTPVKPQTILVGGDWRDSPDPDAANGVEPSVPSGKL